MDDLLWARRWFCVAIVFVLLCGCAQRQEKTFWERHDDTGCCEEYDSCVRVSDGRILAGVMHAKDGGLFLTTRNGAILGEYTTREQAKKAVAESVNRFCEVK